MGADNSYAYPYGDEKAQEPKLPRPIRIEKAYARALDLVLSFGVDDDIRVDVYRLLSDRLNVIIQSLKPQGQLVDYPAPKTGFFDSWQEKKRNQ